MSAPLQMGIVAFAAFAAGAFCWNLASGIRPRLGVTGVAVAAASSQPAGSVTLLAPAASDAAGQNELEAARLLSERSRLRNDYLRLTNRWDLSASQQARFVALLADRMLATSGIIEASRRQGIAPSSADARAVTATIAEARQQYEQSLKELLGTARFDELRRYEQQEPQRMTASEVRQRLLDTSFPLGSDQFDRIVEVLSSLPAGERVILVDAGRRFAAVFPESVTRTREFLRPEQVVVVDELAQEHQRRIMILKSRKARGGPGDAMPPGRR